MKEKECPSCAMAVDSSSKVCPVCGYEFPEQPASYTWIAVFLILLFLLYFIL